MEGVIFMERAYEVLRTEDSLPIKISINNTVNTEMKLQRQLEIILLLKGSITISIKSEKTILKENDTLIINSGTVYNIEKEDEDILFISLLIDKSFFGYYYEDFNKLHFSVKKLKKKDFEAFRYHIVKIIYILYQKSQCYKLSLMSFSFSLAEFLVLNCLVEEEEVDMEKEKHMDRLERIVDYMDENFHNNITLVQVAEYENLSMYYTSHFIKKYLGMSFQEYINIKRLEKSMYLLLNTNKTIGDISRESGFPSPKSLNNAFNKYYEGTPSKYRKGGQRPYANSDNIDIKKLDLLGRLEKYL